LAGGPPEPCRESAAVQVGGTALAGFSRTGWAHQVGFRTIRISHGRLRFTTTGLSLPVPCLGSLGLTIQDIAWPGVARSPATVTWPKHLATHRPQDNTPLCPGRDAGLVIRTCCIPRRAANRPAPQPPQCWCPWCPPADCPSGAAALPVSLARYLAGSCWKSFRQSLQQSLISWPACTKV